MPGRGPDPIATPCARAPDAAITLASASVIFLAPHFNLVSASEVCRPKSYQGSSTPDPDGMLRLHSCNYRSRAMLALPDPKVLTTDLCLSRSHHVRIPQCLFLRFQARGVQFRYALQGSLGLLIPPQGFQPGRQEIKHARLVRIQLRRLLEQGNSVPCLVHFQFCLAQVIRCRPGVRDHFVSLLEQRHALSIFPVLHIECAEKIDRAGVLAVLVKSCARSEEHTSELQSRGHLVCRLLLEKKKT